MLHLKSSTLVVKRTLNTLSSIVIVRLPGNQEMPRSISSERDYPFVPFCCHFITLLLSHNNKEHHSMTHEVQRTNQ